MKTHDIWKKSEKLDIYLGVAEKIVGWGHFLVGRKFWWKNLILMRSGDVDQNTGPIIKSLMIILALVLLLPGDVESNPGPGAYGTCGKCNKDFTQKMTPIECSGCNRKFHKTTCTGSSRWAIEKILAENREWNCKDSIAGRPPQQVQQPHESPTPPGKCQGKDCGN